eukprot:3534620-Amphidinium_carterae.1
MQRQSFPQALFESRSVSHPQLAEESAGLSAAKAPHPCATMARKFHRLTDAQLQDQCHSCARGLIEPFRGASRVPRSGHALYVWCGG